jgi:hypothetical protein
LANEILRKEAIKCLELQNLGNTTYIVHGFASGISVDRDIASDYLYCYVH